MYASVMHTPVLLLLMVGCGESGVDTNAPHPKPGQHDDTGTGDGGEGSGGDGGADGGEDDGGDPPPFEPDEGHWTYTGGDLISNSCDVSSDCVDDSQPNEGGFTLVNHGLERFDLTQDGSDPVGCDRVEKDFDCETWSSGEDVGGHDITIVASLDTEGSFLDETVVMGQHSLSIACQGGDCWLAELFCDISFPCAAVFSFTAEQDEALGE